MAPEPNGHADPMGEDWRDFDPAAYEDGPRRSVDAPLQTSSPGLVKLSAADIFAQLEPIKYVIQALDICPGAPSMWAGYGFSGKTIAAQSLAVVIASNLAEKERRAWGCFSVQSGRAMHIDYEQGSRLTRERYQRLAAPLSLGPDDLGDRLTLVTMPKVYLDQPAAEELLTRELRGYTLCIIDSLRAGAPTLDENSSEIRSVLDMLSRVSEFTGCSFVVIHHARKPSMNAQGGAKMAIRGSGALFDACASVLVFEGEKGRPTRVSHEKACSSGKLTDDFELSISDVEIGSDPRGGLAVRASGIQPEVATDGGRMLEGLKEKVRKLAREGGPLASRTAIASRIGGRKQTALAAIAEMVETGELAETGPRGRRSFQWHANVTSELPNVNL